jgi:hypothetical protein
MMRAMRLLDCRDRFRCASVIAFSVCVLCLSPRKAQAVDPMVGLRSLAMGDSLRAEATGSEGTLLNPSGIAVRKEFATSGFYSLRAQSLGHFLHASVSDSVTQQYLAIGIYYNYFHETPHYSYALAEGGDKNRVFIVDGHDITRTGTEAGAVIAIPFSERFQLGGSLKYGYFSLRSQLHEGDVPDDFAYKNPNIDGDHSVDMGTLGHVISFDLGFTLRLVSQLRLAAVGQNLWAHGTEMPSRLGIGLSYRLNERVLFAADGVIDFTGRESCIAPMPLQDGLCSETKRVTTYRLGGGIEYIAASKLPLRIGYVYNSDLSAHHVSGGLGYLDLERGFGLDFSLRQQVSGGSETVALLGFRVVKN